MTKALPAKAQTMYCKKQMLLHVYITYKYTRTHVSTKANVFKCGLHATILRQADITLLPGGLRIS